MKRIIHVDQHAIKRNAKEGTDLPPLSVKTYIANGKCHEAIVRLPDGTEIGRFVYNGSRLSCGARVWFETQLDVELVIRDHDGVAAA